MYAKFDLETEIVEIKGRKVLQVWRTRDGERDQEWPILKLNAYQAKIAVQFLEEIEDFAEKENRDDFKSRQYKD